MRVVLPNDFEPRPYQRRYMQYFDGGGRRAFWVCHRRAGKDLTALHQTCKEMHRRRGVYWHVFPTAEQGRKALWEGFRRDGKRLMENVFPSAIRKSPKAWLPGAEMVVELRCGSIWRLLGSDRMEVVGAGPVGVTFSEFALARPTTWDLVRPMLRENDGWAAFVTTPRGRNHAKRLFDVARSDSGWFAELQTLYDTRAFDPEATLAEERASGMPEELIRQEYLCDWNAALVGSVWGDLLEKLELAGRAGPDCAFEHERDGVFTSWDLGITDSTAIWFWRVHGSDSAGVGVDVIDHYEAHGQPLSHYFDVLEQRQEEMGYRYVKHWLPHDARAKTLVTGASVLDQFLARYGGERTGIAPQLSLLDGVQAARWLLQKPTRFHARCTEGVEALKAYHYGYDEQKKTFSRKPEHDWSSHSADAFRYLACVVRASESLTRKEPPKADPLAAPPVVRLDDLWEQHERPGRRRI